MTAFFLATLITIFSLFFKKSKVLSIVLFIFIWILFGWNNWNADYPMYEKMYSDNLSYSSLFTYEGGYKFLMFCCKLIHLNFQQFFVFVSGIVLLFLFRFFLIFSYLPAFLIITFFWVFFPLQFVIFRNFIAFVIMLQGLIPVLRNEKYNKQKFIFFVLIASTIHISSLLYLIFLFAFKEEEIKIKNVYFYLFSLLAIIIILHKFVFQIISFANYNKALFYKTSFHLFVFYSLIQIVNLYVVKYFLKYDSFFSKQDSYRVNTIMLNINVIMLFLIPIYYGMAVFIRILLNMSIVNLVFITNKSFLTERKLFPMSLFFIYMLFWFFCFIFLVKEGTIIPLFNNNLILNHFYFYIYL
jgi:hypothetical protein